MSSILVVGSLAYDTVKTPSGSVEKALGGSANYFSVAASLFTKVQVIGVVGKDYLEKDVQMLSSRGVDTSGMTRADGLTFHWAGSYMEDLNEAKTIATELNVFGDFNPVLPASHRNSEFVFLANIHPDLQMQVLDQVEKPLLVGMDTMNFWIQSQNASLTKVLKKVDVVLINEKEAMMLTGARNAIEAAPLLTAMGPRALVIKRGEYGFVLYTMDGGFFILPAHPIPKVVDPTGAGDTFAGGFFGHLASLGRRPTDQDFRRACVFGTNLASFTIQDFSLQALAKVTKPDLEKRIADYQKVVNV